MEDTRQRDSSFLFSRVPPQFFATRSFVTQRVSPRRQETRTKLISSEIAVTRHDWLKRTDGLLGIFLVRDEPRAMTRQLPLREQMTKSLQETKRWERRFFFLFFSSRPWAPTLISCCCENLQRVLSQVKNKRRRGDETVHLTIEETRGQRSESRGAKTTIGWQVHAKRDNVDRGEREEFSPVQLCRHAQLQFLRPNVIGNEPANVLDDRDRARSRGGNPSVRKSNVYLGSFPIFISFLLSLSLFLPGDRYTCSPYLERITSE